MSKMIQNDDEILSAILKIQYISEILYPRYDEQFELD